MSDDLIKRSDAIKIMACEMYAEAQSQGYEADSIEDFMPEAKTWMNDAPSVDTDLSGYSDKLWKNAYERGKADRTQGEWIPCSERLPKENTEVLMSLEWGIDIGECRNGDWHSEWINHYDDGNVLAWMPLPKPWKGADDES